MSYSPNVNNFRMGVHRNYRGSTDRVIDTPGERDTAQRFRNVERQEDRLASDLRSMDNTYLDSDPRRGHVVRYRDGYEAGTGNYIQDETHYAYDRRSGESIGLRSLGTYTTPQGTISAHKDVRWDGREARFEESRVYKNNIGFTTGREWVSGLESRYGIEYEQGRSGLLFGQ